MKKILRIGHQGAAGHAPENRLASISTAIALGIDLVEVDMRRTSDGHLVLLYDECVDRTTNGNGVVGLMTLEAIRKLDAGRGVRVRTLEEALRTASGQIGLILELKANGRVERTCTIVHQSTFTGSVIYTSLIYDEMLLVRDTDPTAMTMALFDRLPKDPVSAAQTAKASCWPPPQHRHEASRGSVPHHRSSGFRLYRQQPARYSEDAILRRRWHRL